MNQRMTHSHNNRPDPQAKQLCPQGLWPSPLSAEDVAGKSPRLSEIRTCGNAVYWLTTLSHEQGRQGIMLWQEGNSRCILPAPFSARSLVHEYGGGSYCVNSSHLYFVEASDQRIYQLALDAPETQPSPITEEAPTKRYADLHWDNHHQRVLAICEDHGDQERKEPQNTIVAIDPINKEKNTTLVTGADFYSNISVSPDARYFSWLQWDHPTMPWDSNELWLAELNHSGCIEQKKKINKTEASHFQPLWSPDGELYYVSDKNNWWNIYRVSALHRQELHSEAVTACACEFATPQWVFGMSTYAFVDKKTIAATFSQDGTWHLCTINLDQQCLPAKPEPLLTDDVDIESIACLVTPEENSIIYIGATPNTSSAVKKLSLLSHSPVALTALSQPLASGDIAKAEAFCVAGEQHPVYGFYYAPTNASYDYRGAPPLIVICHGGPTGATNAGLNLKIQYWTTRGFAVADINYRGSTGYGRDYRRALLGLWGIADVEDLCLATEYLVAEGKADANKLIIKGSSAGGFTVLAALTRSHLFSAGVSLYGIADLEALTKDTHKFEAHYLDTLIGPYPEAKTLYQQRSPIHNLQGFSCPLLLFQGLQDRVVPPEQAEMMARAVKEKGLTVKHITYADEAHGFRQQDTIKHMLETEHQFYIEVLEIR